MTTTTTAILEIMRLNARYNFAIDAGDADAWASCFTQDGVFHALLEGHTPKGTEELAAFVPVCVEAFGAMHHLTTNEVIEVHGDTATQNCYLQFLAEKDGQLQANICIYRDELRLEDGAWRYADRKVDFKRQFAAHTATV